MKTDLFDYDLPREFIAQHPAERRDESRLLVLRRDTGTTDLRAFSNLIDYIEPGDALVVNDTRVVRARLYGRRHTGGVVEVLLIRPARDEPAENVWEAMLNCRGRLENGEEIVVSEGLACTLLGRDEEGTSLVGVRCAGDVNAELDRVGRAPLPPYIKRAKLADPFAAEDVERYQTVYANVPGAVAAPTAGLHFTPELLRKIEASGCEVAPVTLHVGPGTFKPIRVDDVEEHEVDPEYYVVSEETAAAVSRAKRVVAVGTTSCRVLETLARPDGRGIEAGEGWTGLFICPPYEFRVVDCLVTNFHLPKSSLLLLVSAFASRETILAAYEEAKRLNCRFYSYGDAMLII